ncbi:GNAT family N-acetyltransferase [Paenibacillus glacialis]|uniref:N-acetyltransferase domain-containing protein n=1 Tax=Paenibacillus glacialis TaxID=494026 RepID=A0A168IVD9_9BACL|nr:GNAT family N-acetyltransferase [Paenibacillus glacialis]OAB39759.1 hypothetical protein PGLA_18760 [Paenibacillus glacialis]
MKIRGAKFADINGISYVHSESWKTTYRGLLADEYLDKITAEGRRGQWIRTFESLNNDKCVFVAEDKNGRIIGFASGGKCRESELDFDGELYAIYILKEHQGRGVGRLLLKSIVRYLKSKEYKSMMTWVLEGNLSILFYQKLGGQIIKDKEIKIGNETVNEVALGWNEMEEIIR